MNLLLIYILISSIVSFLADTWSGGFKWKAYTYFKLFFSLLPVVPLTVNMALFLLDDRSKMRVLKLNLFRFILMDGYEPYMNSLAAKGEGVYCNQSSHEETRGFGGPHMYLEVGRGSDLDMSGLEGEYTIGVDMEMIERINRMLEGGEEIYLGTEEFSDPSWDYLIKVDFDDFTIKLDNSPIRVKFPRSKITDLLEILWNRDCYADMTFQINRLSIRVFSEHEGGRLSLTCSMGRSTHSKEYDTMSFFKVKGLRYALKEWQKDPSKGVKSSKLPLFYRRGTPVFHMMNAYEIVEAVQKGFVFSMSEGSGITWGSILNEGEVVDSYWGECLKSLKEWICSKKSPSFRSRFSQTLEKSKIPIKHKVNVLSDLFNGKDLNWSFKNFSEDEDYKNWQTKIFVRNLKRCLSCCDKMPSLIKIPDTIENKGTLLETKSEVREKIEETPRVRVVDRGNKSEAVKEKEPKEIMAMKTKEKYKTYVEALREGDNEGSRILNEIQRTMVISGGSKSFSRMKNAIILKEEMNVNPIIAENGKNTGSRMYFSRSMLKSRTKNLFLKSLCEGADGLPEKNRKALVGRNYYACLDNFLGSRSKNYLAELEEFSSKIRNKKSKGKEKIEEGNSKIKPPKKEKNKCSVETEEKCEKEKKDEEEKKKKEQEIREAKKREKEEEMELIKRKEKELKDEEENRKEEEKKLRMKEISKIKAEMFLIGKTYKNVDIFDCFANISLLLSSEEEEIKSKLAMTCTSEKKELLDSMGKIEEEMRGQNTLDLMDRIKRAHPELKVFKKKKKGNNTMEKNIFDQLRVRYEKIKYMLTDEPLKMEEYRLEESGEVKKSVMTKRKSGKKMWVGAFPDDEI